MQINKGILILINIFFVILCMMTILPLWAIISISLSNEVEITKNGFRLIPLSMDLTAYKFIFKNPSTIVHSYIVTFIMSFSALFIYLLIGSMSAYSLSKNDFRYKNLISFYFLFTMLFNGGMVASYLLMTQYLHLKNTYSALIIPLIGNAWYIFIMRTFFSQLPEGICESASIDGAGEFLIYFRIILPLSKPVLATVGMLTLLANWNSWTAALLYIDDPRLYPLQYLLQIMLRNAQEIMKSMENMPVGITQRQDIPSESTRMAMAIIAVGPMLFIFPFFQKYFVGGLTVGAIKG